MSVRTSSSTRTMTTAMTMAIATLGLFVLSSCTSPRDTMVDRPPATTAAVMPDNTSDTTPDATVPPPSATEPGDGGSGTQPTAPDSAPVTSPPDATTDPGDSTPSTPPDEDTEDTDDTEPPSTTSEPSASSIPPSTDGVDVAPPSEDRSQTSLLAALIGLLGFSVLLAFAARWMIERDRQGAGPATHPDDDLPSDQMSL